MLLNPTNNGLCDVRVRIIGGDDDATGDGVDAEGGDGVDAEGGDGADAWPDLASPILVWGAFLHILRLVNRTALSERPAAVSRVVSLEVLFNMTVDGD